MYSKNHKEIYTSRHAFDNQSAGRYLGHISVTAG